MYILAYIIISIISICFGYFILPKMINKIKNISFSKRYIQDDEFDLILKEIADTIIEICEENSERVFHLYDDKTKRINYLTYDVLEKLDERFDSDTLDHISEYKNLIEYTKNVIESNYTEIFKSQEDELIEKIEKYNNIDEAYVVKKKEKNNTNNYDLTSTLNNFYND